MFPAPPLLPGASPAPASTVGTLCESASANISLLKVHKP